MAGLKINICFWYLDETLVDEIIQILQEGNYAPEFIIIKNSELLIRKLKEDNFNLIIADFDLPDQLRTTVEAKHKKYASHIPFIYVVGEKNEKKAADTLKRGVWDYLLKSQFVKLVPTVYSSQKFGKVLKTNMETEVDLLAVKEQFQNLADNSPDIIMRFDKNRRHLYVNKAVKTQLGIDTALFIGKTHSEIGKFPDKMNAVWGKAVDRVFETSLPHVIEFELNNAFFEWRLFPEKDKHENVQTVLAIARNITDTKKSQKVIKDSEERLDMALQATSLGLWDWNILNNEIFFSPIYFEMLGYEPGDFPNKLESWYQFLHDDDLESATKVIETSIRDHHKAFEMVFRMRCKDGSYKWICSRGRSMQFDEQGNTIRLIGTHEDITLRKKHETVQNAIFNIANAVNSTKNLGELFEFIRSHLGEVIDTTNCFLAFYHEDTDTLTLPFHRDEIDSFSEFPAGKTLTGYVVKTGRTQLFDEVREKELIKSGEIEEVGAPCVSWLGVPLKADNKIIGVFVVQSYSEDVIFTDEDKGLLEFASYQIALAIERKKDQDNILKNQEKQRRIFESSPDPIVVVDSKGIVIDYNTALIDVVKIKDDVIIGLPIYYFIHKKHWRSAIWNVKKTWEEGYIKNLEFEVYRKDDTYFESEVSLGAIYDAEGAPESMVIIFKDISKRKENERRLREAKEKAEEADRLKTAFLSNMSHEIRTPMNAIVGFSDLLNDTTISAESRSQFIAQINIGADNLMHLIDDIIDISKIEAGQIQINVSNCTIDKIISEQIVMFRQNLDRLGKSEVELKLNWDWPTETLRLETDPFRIKQVLSNLLGNATKFTDKGVIELGVKQINGFARLSVKDSGIGISEDKQALIFDRFMQGHVSKDRLYGGTGLGLAISKNLVNLLGGDIGVVSVPGVGSEFWFTIPAGEDGQQKLQE